MSPSTDYFALEPFYYEGKTYFLLGLQGGGTDALDEVISFSRSVGGHLFTPSSESEIIAVNNSLYQLAGRTSDDWREIYPKCQSFNCEYNVYQDLQIGYLRQSDESYAWDGDDQDYGNEWLDTQFYYDPYNFYINVYNYDPDDVPIDYQNWSRRAEIGRMGVRNKLDENTSKTSYEWAYMFDSNIRYDSNIVQRISH